MKIIFASKFYYRRTGCESYLFKAKALLEGRGHEIIPFATNHPDNLASEWEKYFCQYLELSKIDLKNAGYNLKALRNMFFNADAFRSVKQLIEAVPDVSLFQGFSVTKHLSHSIFRAAKEAGLPTLMRLSDYGLMCGNRVVVDGYNRLCSNVDCMTRPGFSAVCRKCIQLSAAASFLGALDVKVNHRLGTYRRYVDHIIAPSEFIRQQHIKYYGVEPDRITHVPVFYDASNTQPVYEDDGYILFAGRIDENKGMRTLLEALKIRPHLTLHLAGYGEFTDVMMREAEEHGLNIVNHGFLKYEQLIPLIQRAAVTVMPSEWYENSPNFIMESYAYGKPVVGADIAGIPEMIEPGQCGVLFPPRDADALANALDEALAARKEMGPQARALLDTKYTPERHYDLLMALYSKLLR